MVHVGLKVWFEDFDQTALTSSLKQKRTAPNGDNEENANDADLPKALLGTLPHTASFFEETEAALPRTF